MRTLVPMALVAVVVGAAGCGGGGGGGGGGDPSRFSGSYHTVFLGGTSTIDDVSRGLWGTTDVTGSATANLGPTEQNDGGVLSASATPSPFEHASSSPATLSFLVGAVVQHEGGILPDGQLAALAAALPGNAESSIFGLVRKSTSATTASMAGDHHVVRLVLDEALHVAGLLSATLDTAGAGTVSGIQFNANGTFLGGSGGSAISVTVAADGAMTYEGTTDQAGGIVPGGGGAFLAGGTDTASDRVFAVWIRKASSAGTSTFSGTYTVVGLRYDVGAGVYRAVRGTLASDGAGTTTSTSTYTTHSEGVVDTFTPAGATYSVGTDGTLNAVVAGINVRGGISSDGRFAALVSVDTSGSDPAILLLVRR